MTPLILLGVGVGGGCALVVRAIRPRPVPLHVVVGRIDGSASPSTQRHGIATSTRSRVRGSFSSSTMQSLAVADRSPERHAVEKITTPLALAAIAAAFGGAMQMAPSGIVALALVAGAVGAAVPDMLLRQLARQRRNAFRHALSSYFDLVNVLLAGGAGIETSLEAAADAGDGWVFDELRAALVRARATRRSPWSCFAELGQRFDIEELVELSASVQLAGEQGARIRSSLSAKATALRAHQLARIEADALSASERMGLPTVLMFLGFLMLLGYPAMRRIMGL